ncbi:MULTISPECIES: arginyltransferase [unclassified Rhodanobacter]|jgi:arginyl-tRNA--protein-N-Asp/Glu arginylyltransferase|uniref:arginyltransferase n=1 Tax=unclassified Rhodanobacter TaxID=2621553 RepID=UPI00161D0C41|nr:MULTISPECIES: arginyltransferase [unclassified Rhodanobacter]MBB6242199.1 arginine-tRNA-protein transferase [Rhodanobacter sp. MP1X3]MBB6245586.1 arginine-tRNA-protein transferase [Rhodanobacter sp. A1T4]
MRAEPTIRLFQTLPHACGYYAERTAQNLVIDPAAPQLDKLYGPALEQGFRRAGGHLYFPQCPQCHACTPCRVNVENFQPDRSQRRCLKRNADLSISESIPSYNRERHALYESYLRRRHVGGGMDEAEASDFRRFLTAPWSPTLFLEIRNGERLLAIAVTDVCLTGVSAVYTFFDPAESARSLGTFAILQQIELARRRGIPWLYLGFWIDGHPKMDYKRRFQPLEIRKAGSWLPMLPS